MKISLAEFLGGKEADDAYNKLCELTGVKWDAERTCQMTKKGPEYVLAGWWECSECGPVYPPCNDEIAVWALQKCPRCGARAKEAK